MARIERSEYIVVSSDAEAKANNEGTRVLVTFVFEGFTEKDYIDRLMVSSSPKVAVAGVLRKKNPIPSKFTYIVPKAGTRAVPQEMTIDQMIEHIMALPEPKRSEYLAVLESKRSAMGASRGTSESESE